MKNSPAMMIWIAALASLLVYVVRLALQQPKGHRLPLFTYWLLFVFGPLVVFAIVFSFSTSALMGGVVLLIVLVIVGEHGYRRWNRLFRRREDHENV